MGEVTSKVWSVRQRRGVRSESFVLVIVRTCLMGEIPCHTSVPRAALPGSDARRRRLRPR
jgi:hypothetical protein